MKKPINEIKRMQLIAGLITESEYHQSLSNEAKYNAPEDEEDEDDDNFPNQDIAKQNHIEALQKKIGTTDLKDWNLMDDYFDNSQQLTIRSELKDRSAFFETIHDRTGKIKRSGMHSLLSPTSLKSKKSDSSTSSLEITPEQKAEFLRRIKYLTKMEDSDYAFEEAGNILARVLTDDEIEWIEDVEEFGYNPDEVEQFAQDLINK